MCPKWEMQREGEEGIQTSHDTSHNGRTLSHNYIVTISLCNYFPFDRAYSPIAVCRTHVGFACFHRLVPLSTRFTHTKLQSVLVTWSQVCPCLRR